MIVVHSESQQASRECWRAALAVVTVDAVNVLRDYTTSIYEVLPWRLSWSSSSVVDQPEPERAAIYNHMPCDVTRAS